VGIGTFMAAIDASVVNAILPVIQRAFGSTVAGIEWVMTVYLVVVSGLLLSFGRLGDLRGHKKVWVLGFVGFILGSALCGMAPSAQALVVFRAVQALGAAMVYANAPAIITRGFPIAERGKALGLQSAMAYIGLMLGPALGGWLTGLFSWRAVFYINVPVGLIGMLISIRFVTRDAEARKAESFDVAGAAVFLAGLVALLIGLDQGHAWGWASAPILGLLALSAALMALFVRIERRSDAPLLDLGMFRQRLFAAATVSAVLNYICLYSVLFLLPYYLLEARGLSPARAGLMLSAQPLMVAVVTPMSGALSDRIGSRWLGAAGMALTGLGLIVLSRLGPHSALGMLTAGLAVVGAGMGLFIAPNNNALMSSAPRHRQGVAGGVLATARNVGEVLGIGLAGAVFTTVMAHRLLHGAADISFAVDMGLLAAAACAGLGAITSAARGAKPAR
jgi:EmrB/QacA subfamily drug resistance transporter